MTTIAKNSPTLLFTFVWLTVILIAWLPLTTWGQIRIAEVEFNGRRASQVEIIVVKPKERPSSSNVKPQDAFPSGTIFQIPARTVVWLSTNDNRQRLGPGSKHQVTAGANGESHQTFVGRVTHYVTSLLNFYKTSGPSPKYQLAAEGTEFTIQAIGKDVRLEMTEGTVAVQQRVPCQIAEPAKVERKKERELTTTRVTKVSAGEPERTFAHNSDELITYATYEEAIADYRRQIYEYARYNDGAEYLVDDYITLGEIYLDMGEPAKAIDPLTKAIQSLKKIDPDDPFIAESYIDLAEAYYYSGDEESGDESWNIAVEILEEEIPYYEEEYDYFLDEEDRDTAWSIGQDLADMYDALGWAYELIEDDDQADDYYRLLEELEEELDTL